MTDEDLGIFGSDRPNYEEKMKSNPVKNIILDVLS
jgi:hypothetical protein